MDVNLSLKVTNGVYVCMPLYSADLSANMSALVVSLQSTDITVCVRKELACQAAFHNFKVKFIDNFDDQVLEFCRYFPIIVILLCSRVIFWWIAFAGFCFISRII